MDNFQKYQRRNLIIILLVLVGLVVFYAVQGGRAAPDFEMDESRFVLRGPENFETEIILESISSVELLDSFRPETCISGGTVDNCAYGTWENAALGRYRLCILLNVKNGILVTEKDGTRTVFNFESTQTTEEFYKSFVRIWEDAASHFE